MLSRLKSLIRVLRLNSTNDLRSQAAVEYILLVALGLFIIIVGFTLAFYVNDFTNSVLVGVDQTRRQAIALLVR